ncbi:hypothetical protein HAX54_042385, partial [Datura stramonium]|nr:hypothetical protein [Datura stramonium]
SSRTHHWVFARRYFHSSAGAVSGDVVVLVIFRPLVEVSGRGGSAKNEEGERLVVSAKVWSAGRSSGGVQLVMWLFCFCLCVGRCLADRRGGIGRNSEATVVHQSSGGGRSWQ